MAQGWYDGESDCRFWYVGRITVGRGYPGGGPDKYRGRVGFYGDNDIGVGGYQVLVATKVVLMFASIVIECGAIEVTWFVGLRSVLQLIKRIVTRF